MFLLSGCYGLRARRAYGGRGSVDGTVRQTWFQGGESSKSGEEMIEKKRSRVYGSKPACCEADEHWNRCALVLVQMDRR